MLCKSASVPAHGSLGPHAQINGEASPDSLWFFVRAECHRLYARVQALQVTPLPIGSDTEREYHEVYAAWLDASDRLRSLPRPVSV